MPGFMVGNPAFSKSGCSNLLYDSNVFVYFRCGTAPWGLMTIFLYPEESPGPKWRQVHVRRLHARLQSQDYPSDPCVMGWGLAGTGNSSAVAAVAAAPQNVCFLGNGFLRERVEYERSRRDTTAILIVRTLRFYLWTLKKSENPKKSKRVVGTFPADLGYMRA